MRRRTVLAVGLVLAGGCNSEASGASCPVGPSQGSAEQCCLSYGADACGAGLFCAAFDGRTVPTCYSNGSRRDGQTCTADAQCSSMSCNTMVDACRTAASMCDPEIGCAPQTGSRRTCVPSNATQGTCQDVGNGTEGSLCADDTDCTAGRCDASTARCSSGTAPNLGARCSADADCRAPTGMALCRPLVAQSSSNLDGYCVQACDYSAGSCPSTHYCLPPDGNVISGPGSCVPLCATADECPQPDLACGPAATGASPDTAVCRLCIHTSECRAGLSCVPFAPSSSLIGTCR